MSCGRASVVGTNIVIKKKCSRKKILKLYKVLPDDTIFIYPKFKVLWSAFLNTYLGAYSVSPFDGPPDYPLPSPLTGTLSSIGILNDDFVIFRRVDPLNGGPIINVEPRIVVMDVFNNSLDYQVNFVVTVPNGVDPGVISFYSASVLVNDYSLNISRENELTRFPVILDRNRQYRHTTTLWNLHDIAVNYSQVRFGATVELEITAQIPNPEPLTLETLPNRPFNECLKFRYCGCNKARPSDRCCGCKYKLITTTTEDIPDSDDEFLTTASEQFAVLASLIRRTLQITAKLPPLVPIEPIESFQSSQQIIVTDQNYMRSVQTLDCDPLTKFIPGVLQWWSVITPTNPNACDWGRGNVYYGLCIERYNGPYTIQADIQLNNEINQNVELRITMKYRWGGIWYTKVDTAGNFCTDLFTLSNTNRRYISPIYTVTTLSAGLDTAVKITANDPCDVRDQRQSVFLALRLTSLQS